MYVECRGKFAVAGTESKIHQNTKGIDMTDKRDLRGVRIRKMFSCI